MFAQRFQALTSFDDVFSDLQKLQQSRTDSELRSDISALLNENEGLGQKLEKLRKGDSLVDLDEKRKVKLHKERERERKL
jgi:uncharacterized protein YwgA